MSNSAKKWLIAAFILIVTGALLFTFAMRANNWSLIRANSDAYQTISCPVEGTFSNITLNSVDADIVFAPSEDGSCSVLFYLPEEASGTATVRDDTLFLDANSDVKWFLRFRFTPVSPKITVCLPAGAYKQLAISEHTGDIQIPDAFSFADAEIITSTGAVNCQAPVSGRMLIKTTTGEIRLRGISCREMALTSTTGDITLRNVTVTDDISIDVSTAEVGLEETRCRSLLSSGSTGDMRLKHVTAAKEIHLTRTTGDIVFTGCDAAELNITTKTGEVTGSLLSDKTFSVKTSTGDVRVPDTAGGPCRVETTTGDVRLTVRAE